MSRVLLLPPLRSSSPDSLFFSKHLLSRHQPRRHEPNPRGDFHRYRLRQYPFLRRHSFDEIPFVASFSFPSLLSLPLPTDFFFLVLCLFQSERSSTKFFECTLPYQGTSERASRDRFFLVEILECRCTCLRRRLLAMLR